MLYFFLLMLFNLFHSNFCGAQAVSQNFELKNYVVPQIEQQVQALELLLRKPYDDARTRLLSENKMNSEKRQRLIQAYQELATTRVQLYKTEQYLHIAQYLEQLRRTPFEYLNVSKDFLQGAHQLSRDLMQLKDRNFLSLDSLQTQQKKARQTLVAELAEKTVINILTLADKEYDALASSQAALNKEVHKLFKRNFKEFVVRLSERFDVSDQALGWPALFQNVQSRALALNKQHAQERMLTIRLSLASDYSSALAQATDSADLSEQKLATSKVGRDIANKDRLQEELNYLHKQSSSALSGYAPLVDVIGAFNVFGISELFFFFLPDLFTKALKKPIEEQPVQPEFVPQPMPLVPEVIPAPSQLPVQPTSEIGRMEIFLNMAFFDFPISQTVQDITALFNANGWWARSDLMNWLAQNMPNYYRNYTQEPGYKNLSVFDVVALFNVPEFTNWLIKDYKPSVVMPSPIKGPAVAVRLWMQQAIHILGQQPSPTALAPAVRQAYPRLLSALFAVKVATPDTLDFTHETLLGYALERKSAPLVKLLLEGGANPRRKVFDMPGAGPARFWGTVPRDLAKDNPELLALIDQYLNPQAPAQESVPSEQPAQEEMPPSGPQYAMAVDYIDNNFLKRPYSPEEQARALFHTWYEIPSYRDKPLFQYALQQFVKKYRNYTQEPGYQALTELGAIALMNDPRAAQWYLQYNLASKKNEIISDIKQTIAALCLPAEGTPWFATMLRERYPQALAVVFRSISPDTMDYPNQTLLGYALEHKSVPVVQLLLEGGADPNRHVYAQSLRGDYLPNDNYPLDLAKKNAELTELLKKYGATKQH
jgi:hypothetical protein